MIADDVSGVGDFAGNVGALADVASDHEEGRADIVPGEHVEEFQRVWVVRAVVVGERDLLASAGEAGERAAEPLAGRCHGLIAERDRSGRRGDSGEKGKHGEIVEELRATSYEL